MSQTIQNIALPHLDYMTKQVAKQHFEPLGTCVTHLEIWMTFAHLAKMDLSWNYATVK